MLPLRLLRRASVATRCRQLATTQVMTQRHDASENDIVVIGAGPAGCLLAICLLDRGYKNVTILEKGRDMRAASAYAGKSINLIMTSRGINALNGVGLAGNVLDITVPVHGRTLHSMDSSLAYQSYGPDESFCNYSVSRSGLNIELMNAAEHRGAKILFEHGLDHLDIQNKIAFSYTQDGYQASLKSFRAKHFFATDGAGSRARQALAHMVEGGSDRTLPLGAGYKELFMPTPPPGSCIANGSLHIWPRGSHFLMALENMDGSFTMTLYMPDEGEISFASLSDDATAIQNYFEKYYPDAAPLMPDYLTDFIGNPVGFLGTLRTAPFHYKDHLALLGDAAHAITPFFGQGCNCAFEGVAKLVEKLDSCEDMATAFAEYDSLQKPNADAIGNMAMENYVEMMDKTADRQFLLAKQVEHKLAKEFPIYCSRYVMVTHTLIPYHVCESVGRVQEDILSDLCTGLSDAEAVDMERAKHLIQTKLKPELDRFGVTEESYRSVMPTITR